MGLGSLILHRQHRADLALHAVLPLLPARCRRPAAPLLQAPGALPDVDLGLKLNASTTRSSLALAVLGRLRRPLRLLLATRRDHTTRGSSDAAKTRVRPSPHDRQRDGSEETEATRLRAPLLRRGRDRRRRRRPARGDRGPRRRARTAIVCKSLLGKAHTVMAEGGIAAAMGNRGPRTTGRCTSATPCVAGRCSTTGGWPSCTRRRRPSGCRSSRTGARSSTAPRTA